MFFFLFSLFFLTLFVSVIGFGLYIYIPYRKLSDVKKKKKQFVYHGNVSFVLCNIRNFILKKFFKNSAPYPGKLEISSEWFEKNIVNKKVKNINFKVLGENRGFQGDMNIMDVEYEDGTKGSFFVKSNRTDAHSKAYGLCTQSYREARFYGSSYYKEFEEQKIAPKIYYTYHSKMMAEFLFIMENLNNYDSLGVNFLYGNQIWGIPEDKQKKIPKDYEVSEFIEAVFYKTAIIHAKYWNQEKLKHSGLKAADWYLNTDRVYWESGLDGAVTAWEVAKEKSKKEEGFEINEKLEKIIENSFKETTWENFQQYLNRKDVPFTLTHGDFHAANMIILLEDINKASENNEKVDVDVIKDSIRFFDFSEIGLWEPGTELAQTIISDVKPELFTQENFTYDLVEKYYNRVCSLNNKIKDSITLETLYERFCKGGVGKWFFYFPLLASMDIPPVAKQYFHDQILAFIESHGDYDSYPLFCCIPLL
eukprot:TRINITY_DN3698_c0_g1_i1.p1 TRINITY_DN3698_c0_g1~~TRINITY_DN3698_c0_g1_i1.p1  ORF type:complete len:478 (-),score=151.65 TRINITY_DN3698_c0_g1_i1:97-1530(-)